MGFLELITVDPGTIIWTLLNLGVIVLILKFLLFGRVGAVLEKRMQLAESSIAEAKTAEENAKKLEAQYNEKISAAKEEAGQIIATAVKKAQTREEEIIAEANKAAIGIRKKAEDEIEREKKRAVNEIKNEVTELVVMAASKVIEREIKADDNKKIIDSFLADIGDAI